MKATSAVALFRRPARIERDGRETEHAALVANVPGAIYRCAPDDAWTMTLISDEIERISGYRGSDFVLNSARTFASIIHPDDRAEVEREVRAATADDRPFGLEYRIVRSDGTVAWVLERGQPVTEADQQVWLHGVIFDITKRKQAEEVLRQREVEEARIAELHAARVRIIAAQDEARRGIERDLHDGAQQRLVSLALLLRMTRGKLPGAPAEAADLLDEAIGALAEATAELRELARGIHPAVLTECGLYVAVTGLAARAPLPVEVECSLSERLPEQVEAAAYYVVAESLTNIARHADAQNATIRLHCDDRCAVVEVADDGVGGADSAGGSGLRGLRDRIDALEGTLVVRSESRRGTRVRATIPLHVTSSVRPTPADRPIDRSAR